MDVPSGDLYLGRLTDPSADDEPGEPVLLASDDLTTHGLIVGMTGSGKTGLGIILAEEAQLAGIPVLVIDPKGDMANLKLRFPDLASSDFEPWMDATAARRDGTTVADAAAATSQRWRAGLEGSGTLGRLADLATAPVEVYTPGSNAGIPLNVIGSMRSPTGDLDDETLAEEVETLTSSLLGLVGIDSDPLSGREHILVANLVHRAWSAGDDTDLAQLIAQIQDPPMRKLGVIDLDGFFPPEDRRKLALKLNGLTASTDYAAWTAGAPLDIDTLLGADGGATTSVISIAHLDDDERQFVVAVVLSKLITWARSQPGTGELRALVYMDEVFGFVPPIASPPAKKPILTLLKQARAYGVGIVLATQNPVDLDYKAISNAGTWMIGRLQTEQDRARLLDGLAAATGTTDIAAVEDTIAGLEGRQFVLRSVHRPDTSVFSTRWAMSYLAGPLSRDQLRDLTADRPDPPARAGSDGGRSQPGGPAESPPPAATPELPDDVSEVMPAVADGVAVRYLDPAAPWAAEVGGVSGATVFEAALAARVEMLFDDRAADLRHTTEWEAVIHPLGEQVDGDDAIAVDHDSRDLRSQAPDGARYRLCDAPLDSKRFFISARSALRDHLVQHHHLELFVNRELKAYSRPDESRDDFEARCARLADDEADREVDKLRESLAKKIDRVNAAIDKAEDRVRETSTSAKSSKGDELLSAAGDLLGGLLGGRKSTSSILGSIRRASSRRRRSSSAAERVESAKNRLEQKVDEREALEEELADSLEEIKDAWDAKATEIETVEIGLEKNDVTVDDLVVVWIPVER